MIKCNLGHVQLGVPAGAERCVEEAELYADLCCIYESLAQHLGTNSAINVICQSIEAVFETQLDNEKENN